ncbi:MAG: mechanosensitive ion channel protein MscS [Nitrospinae bacterium CG11_big_fil_rev_8_21_14_0_20_56_8]|nr:MAG: mechanosensitive ion channel protein MscS [Nitrospinae bacterium CG11_big_fil_rev_8_21_14_0_20_56_8]
MKGQPCPIMGARSMDEVKMSSLQTVVGGNSILQWIFSLVFAALAWLLLSALKKRLREQVTTWGGDTVQPLFVLFGDLIDRTRRAFLLFLAVFFGSLFLTLPVTVTDIRTRVLILVVLFQGAVWGIRFVSFWVDYQIRLKNAEDDKATATMLGVLRIALKVALWAIVILVALDNLGVDTSALLAGLGLGGLAMALAAQNILGDLFGSLTIVMDKPFVIGDFIILGDIKGTVENIGLKTTRIRSLSGELLIVPNSDLLKGQVRNFKRMQERRVCYVLGVVYQTPLEKLKRAVEIIREVIEAQEKTRFERAHFKEYGAYSLNIEVVFWVLDSDYQVYMDINQQINFLLYERYRKEGIEFAYPTQSLLVEKLPSEPGPASP